MIRHEVFNSLKFKFGVIIILIEVVALSITGIIYVTQFSNQVDDRLISRAQIPGNLIAGGKIDYDVVRDREQLIELIGDDPIEAMVISITQIVLYSLNTQHEGKIVSEIHEVQLNWFTTNTTTILVLRETEGSNNFITVITPVLALEGSKPYYFVYIKISANNAAVEKQNIVLLFILGSVLCIVSTTVVIIVSFKKMLLNRINNVVQVLKRIQDGDLTARVDGRVANDEIGILQNGVNSMATYRMNTEEKLQKAHNKLEERIAERTKELKQANIHLKSLDQLKSMFLASMSHELRTPLNSIIGFTGWLLMGMVGDLNEEQRKQLTMVKYSANHLLELINDILDISKIEAGKVELVIEKFEIIEVINDIVNSVLPLTNDKRLEFIHDVPEGLILNSDKRRIKQILMNLARNAIKFTDQGNVKIDVKTINNNDLEFIVSDSGIGIKKEDMEKLFQPFQQIDMSSTKRHEGTGLGLYL